MRGYLTDFSGRVYEMPALISWDISHGFGTPCDAFELCFGYSEKMLETLSAATRFRAEHEGETVFAGVVDEFELTAGADGPLVSVRGRGMAALLLDNEAEAAQYWTASLDFILDRHVYPWGIGEARYTAMPGASNFVVDSGASQWRVLEEFARFAGDVRPRFSPDGVLILDNEPGRTLRLDGSDAMSGLRYREKRYGVISRALVKNKSWGISSSVDNTEFLARGGSCRRVINMPRGTYYDALRHTGEYQIERSKEDMYTLELTVPELFAAFPADVVELKLSSLGLEGSFEVRESRCFAHSDEAGTALTLGRLT